MDDGFEASDCIFEVISDESVSLVKYKGESKAFEVPVYVTHNNIRYYIFKITKSAFILSQIKHICFEKGSRVTEIEDYGLFCFSLSSVVIPKSLKVFYRFSFNTDFELSVEEGNRFLITSEDRSVYRKHPFELIKASLRRRHFTIRESITRIIAFSLYKHHSLRSIIFPTSIVSIDAYAFSNCENLRTIVFKEPSKLVTIEKSAFSDTKIDKVVFPASLKYIQESAFKNCPIDQIVFPIDSKLEIIQIHSFSGTNIKKLNFPSSLLRIGSGAFEACIFLRIIKFEEDTRFQSIEGDSFAGSNNIIRIICPRMIKRILKNDQNLASKL